LSEQEELHWSQVGGVKNLCFEHIAPRPKAQGWRCTKPECNDVKMNLLPVSRDLPATHWECTKCKRKITIEERNQVFLATIQMVQDKYIIHVAYNKQHNQWHIWSMEWTGETRLEAQRKKLTSIEREEITDQLLATLEDNLQIQFETIRDYFREE
jgi:hypothetical protein